MTKTFLITGCTHGLGRELALRFAKENFIIFAVGRDKELIKGLSMSSKNIIPLIADIAKVEGRNMIFSSIQNNKSISIIHNAAIVTPSMISHLSENLLRKHFETNFFAPYFLNKKLLSLLDKNSRVLNISSGAAELAIPGLMPYCTSKGALEHMTTCFNAEFNSNDIYFANLRPGMIDTQMQERLRASNSINLPGKDFYLNAKKENKLRSASEVAKFVYWVMLKTNNMDFSNTLWDINEITNHEKWLC